MRLPYPAFRPLHFLLFGLLLLLGISCSSSKSSSTTSPQSIVIKSDSWTESIHIQEGRISYVKTQYFYPQPHIATPDSSAKTFLLNQQAVPSKKLEQLVKELTDFGFFELKSSYGAPEGQRYYGYSVQITTKDRSHTVEFRSNPSFEEAPEAFQKAQEAIRDFAKSQMR